MIMSWKGISRYGKKKDSMMISMRCGRELNVKYGNHANVADVTMCAIQNMKPIREGGNRKKILTSSTSVLEKEITTTSSVSIIEKNCQMISEKRVGETGKLRIQSRQ